MKRPHKRRDIDGEIDEVFQAGNRKDDPVAKISGDRFKAQVHSQRLSHAAVRAILRDGPKISFLIEKTRQDLASAEADPGMASAPRGAIDRDLAKEILSGQAALRSEISELRTVTTELKAATEQTVAATADLKGASQDIHTEVKKAVRALTVGAAFRTAVYLTPFTLVSSVTGNEVTPAVHSVLHTAVYWAFGWKDSPTVPSAPPPPPPNVVIDQRQYWIVIPPRDEMPLLPFPSERPFVIPQAPIVHHRPHPAAGHRPKAKPLHAKGPL